MEQYIFVPERDKVTLLEHFSTKYLINLCNYKLLLEGNCRKHGETRNSCVFVENFLESINLQDWVKFQYISLRRIVESEAILTQSMSDAYREVY